MRIVFMGSADFGIPSLDRLREEHELAAIVSTPPKPRGRGLKVADSPVTVYARNHGIEPILTPESLDDNHFIERLSSLQAAVFVVIAFRILPRAVFSLPPLGAVNVHASLLPRYRGSAPIQRAIEAGEQETGVTVFQIDEGVDTGQALMKKATTIGPDETTPELYTRLSLLGAEALLETLRLLERGAATPLPRTREKVTRAPKLRKEEARIDWRLPASQLFNKIRAFKPFPGVYTVFRGKRMVIEWAIAVAADYDGRPGEISAVHKNSFDVLCGTGLLRVLAVKPAGKKAMSAEDWLRGAQLEKGMQLE